MTSGRNNNNHNKKDEPKPSASPINFGNFLSSRQGSIQADDDDLLEIRRDNNNNEEFKRGATQQLPVHVPSPDLMMMSSMMTMEPLDYDGSPHKQHGRGGEKSKKKPGGRRRLADFIWEDKDIYEQRSWIGALSKDPDSRFPAQQVSSFPTPASTPNAVSGKHMERRRRRMTAGSTLRTIGEQSILAGSAGAGLGGTLAPPNMMYSMDVKAWPTFSHYKATLAQLNAQRTRMKIVIGANGIGGTQSRSPPLVVRGRKVQVLAHQKGLPPTFGNIVSKGSTSMIMDKKYTSSSSTKSKDPLFGLHLIKLAVIDGQEGKACAILRDCFGIPIEPALELTKATLPKWTGLLPNLGPIKLELLTKPKLWPSLLRIWMRAVERGMETLLLMLYAAGIPRYPQGPLSFLAPKKPPKPSSSSTTAMGVMSAASSIISSSTVSGWLERNYQDWIRGRFPSFFMAAIAFGRHVLVRAILNQRKTSSLLASTWLGISPLLLASAEASRHRHISRGGRLWIVKELLDNGAVPLASGISLYTLLHLKEKLLTHQHHHHYHHEHYHSHPSNVHQCDQAHKHKVINKHSMVNPELWAKGKVIYPVELAAACLNFELVIALLGRSALYRYQLGLLLQTDLDITIRLIKGGALIHPTDAYGNGPIHWAAAKGKLDLVAVLLHYGAPIDAVNVNGWSPLHQAAYYSHRQVIRYLIEAGADCSLLNSDGLTALQVARRHGLASEDLLDYFTTATTSNLDHPSTPPLSDLRDDVDALIRQVEAFNLDDDRDPLPEKVPELPVKQRRGRFLIERIISLPRQWLSSSIQEAERPPSPQL